MDTNYYTMCSLVNLLETQRIIMTCHENSYETVKSRDGYQVCPETATRYVPKRQGPEVAMYRVGHVPKRQCPEVTMSRNGKVPKRSCPETARSRNGHVPKRLCPETSGARWFDLDSTRFTRPVAATQCAIDATCRLPQYRVPVPTSRDVSSSETESDDLASGRVAGRRIESWEQ